MKRYLAFDTETTGLVQFRADPGSSVQPDMVQLAAILYDLEREYATINLIVESGVELTDEVVRIHGISQEIVRDFGVPRSVAVAMFNNLVRKADELVAHNLNFDMRVIQTAYYRENKDPSLLIRPTRTCTMLDATPVMQLPNPKRPDKWKWPNLQESYKYFVDSKGFDGAHDAMADARACVEVHRAMVRGYGEAA